MHFHIFHNAPYLPHKILHNLLRITAVPRETENNAYTKFGGSNKVHYGKCGNGVCPRVSVLVSEGELSPLRINPQQGNFPPCN